ncbi:MAG TPA: AAA family ATPase, partial [Solirubrobacteraceae bacterium]|nr:AAA family ATPase [Solirubrobacteraceae bacterium]
GPDLDGAVAAATAAVDAAPFRESSRARLIEALRAQGDAAGALRAFEDVRELLRDELGATPGPELTALHDSLDRDRDREPPRRAERAPAPARLSRLVEREHEIGLIDGLQDRLAAGEGRIVLIEGPAGLGKTQLLVEARRRAAAAGATVLNARASELERGFAFGVVRQLFEAELADPARRGALLGGAAAPATAVFAPPDAAQDGETAVDASFAVLHGLYWLVVNLAADRPLVLAVDDLHWCDRPSLRLLTYLVRRLEDLPVLVAATLRTGEQVTDPALLDEVVHDPATVSIRPGPLSPEAVEAVVRGRLGDEAGAAFAAACHETTGGNPLLLQQLLAALEAEGVTPADDHVARVREIGPRAVSRTIGLRLARMSPEAVAIARAVAVLGENAEVATVATLAGLDVDTAAAAAAALSRAEILAPEPPLGFVHPLVRDAVYYALPVGERELHHRRAAGALAEAGAAEEQVAVHLVKAPPAGDPDVAATLQRAGASAARKGAPESAVAFLRRALAEPPPPERRAELLLELGVAEQRLDGVAAAEHLAAAYAALDDPAARGTAALALAETLFFAAPPGETLRFVRAAGGDTPQELVDVRLGLEAYETMTLVRGGVGETDLEERLAEYEEHGLPEHDGPGGRMLEAVVAYGWALGGHAAEPCAQLALRSLAGGTLAEVDDGFLLPGPLISLTLCDSPEALSEWDAVLDAAYRRGSLLLTLTAHIWRGYELLARGELHDAERSLRESLSELALWGSGQVISIFPMTLLAMVLVERGELTGARDVLRSAPHPPEGSQGHFFLLQAETELALAEGRGADALVTAERLRRVAGERANPAWQPVHDLIARALVASARVDEARAAAATGME